MAARTSVLALVALAIATMTLCRDAAGNATNAPVWGRHGGQQRASTCSPGQLFCSDECDAVLLCIGDANPVVVEECATNTTCDRLTATCVTGSECIAPPDKTNLVCHATGWLPNPYDCTRYHLCLVADGSATGTNEVCPTGKAYDALSTRCSLALDSRPCTAGPVPPCTSAGQAGPQPENPNIYYVCARSAAGNLVPLLFKCLPAQEFVVDHCVDVVPTTAGSTTSGAATPTTSSGMTTTTGTSVTTTTTGTSTTSTTGTSTTSTTGTSVTTTTTGTPTTTSPTAFTCPGVGQFADPTDCHKYWLCQSDLVAQSFSCQSGYYFEPSKGCIRGTCSSVHGGR